MAEDKTDNYPEADDRNDLVIITDEDGNETYYEEEMVIPLAGKNFALLTPAEDEDSDEVLIARIDFAENGDPVYLDPTEEEFEAVRQEYERMMDEIEGE